MAIASKALDFLENIDDRDSSKPKKSKINERDVAEHKLFGKKKNKILIGKKFGKKGKDVGKKGEVTARMDKHSKGVSPSMAEFDKMVASAAKNIKDDKKSLFGRKG
jgi:hypothetical protein